MTNSWIAWILTAAGVAGACGVLWGKVLRPMVRGFTRFLSLLDQLLEVLKEWPVYQAMAMVHAADITDLTGQIGEIRVIVDRLVADVHKLLRRRAVPPPPATRALPPVKKAQPRGPRNESP